MFHSIFYVFIIVAIALTVYGIETMGLLAEDTKNLPVAIALTVYGIETNTQ